MTLSANEAARIGHHANVRPDSVDELRAAYVAARGPFATKAKPLTADGFYRWLLKDSEGMRRRASRRDRPVGSDEHAI